MFPSCPGLCIFHIVLFHCTLSPHLHTNLHPVCLCYHCLREDAKFWSTVHARDHVVGKYTIQPSSHLDSDLHTTAQSERILMSKILLNDFLKWTHSFWLVFIFFPPIHQDLPITRLSSFFKVTLPFSLSPGAGTRLTLPVFLLSWVWLLSIKVLYSRSEVVRMRKRERGLISDRSPQSEPIITAPS